MLPRSVLKDTTPPRPGRHVDRPASSVPGPELLPAARRRRRRPSASARRWPTRACCVFRTGPRGAAARAASEPLERGATSWEWDGTRRRARACPPGTYLVGRRVARRGRQRRHVGAAGPRRPAACLRRARCPGAAGSPSATSAPQPPVDAGQGARAASTVVRRRAAQRYTWSLRRVGAPRAASSAGAGRDRCVTIARARRRERRLPLRGAHARPHDARRRARAGAAQRAGTARKPRGVLVVLPAMTWQGRNAVDDDGDGAPEPLDARRRRAARAHLRRRRAAGGLRRRTRRRCSAGWTAPAGATTSRPTSRCARDAGRSSRATAASCSPATRAGCRRAVRAAAARLRRGAAGRVRLARDRQPAAHGRADAPRARWSAPSARRADRPLRRAAAAGRAPAGDARATSQDDDRPLRGHRRASSPGVTAWEETAPAGREADARRRAP